MLNYDIRNWSEQQVVAWLTENQFGHYADTFLENDVNGQVLVELDNTLLKELDVPTVGERVKIMVALKKLRQACVNATRRALQDEMAGDTLIYSSNNHDDMVFGNDKGGADRLKQNLIRVTGPGNQTCVVNVTDAMGAQAVLTKVLHKFHIDPDLDDTTKYRLFVPTGESNVARMLHDNELMDICRSTDRPEKNRLVLRVKHSRQRGMQDGGKRKPAPQKQLAPEPAVSPSRTSSFFGERPASEMISNNLSEFFPDQQQELLETVTENRIRHTIYRKAKRVTMLRAAKVGPPNIMPNEPLPMSPELDAATLVPTAKPALIPVPEATVADKRLTREDIKDMVDEKLDEEEMETFTEMLMNQEVMAIEEQKKEEGITQWIKGSMIGTGSFGHVYLGLNPLTGELLAAKQVELPNSSGSDERREMMLKALQREIDLLKDLDHENIVRYLGSHRDEQHLNIFLEYVPGGSVASMLINYGPFQEPLVKSYLRQILLGLDYLHGQGIIHRDIKGGNILVDNRGVIKISDFGVSKRDESEMMNTNATHRASLQGSVFWMAPEVVKKQHYTPKADIWSLGCLVVEMFTGDHPFPNLAQMQAIFKIGSDESPEIPRNISEDAQDFLKDTFSLDTESRPAASILLQHAFVSTGNNNK
ncbi:kinase-like domain-containing protein [Syncephalis fuscata]|nr:kinase-like domain-containing protein [Syncephalis fuscata]